MSIVHSSILSVFRTDDLWILLVKHMRSLTQNTQKEYTRDEMMCIIGDGKWLNDRIKRGLFTLEAIPEYAHYLVKKYVNSGSSSKIPKSRTFWVNADHLLKNNKLGELVSAISDKLVIYSSTTTLAACAVKHQQPKLIAWLQMTNNVNYKVFVIPDPFRLRKAQYGI